MRRAEVRELHYIAPIANLLSILEHGILCHRLARELNHVSIANAEVQDRRVNKRIPDTDRTLHDFANLYFDAHNPMLSDRRAENDRICIVRVSPDVPDRVEPRYLRGLYVANHKAEEACRNLDLTLPLRIRGDIFFQVHP